MAIDTIKATAIFDGTVDTADLADDAVTTAKINAGAVDTTELADDAVTTAKINAGAVTNVKIDGMASSKLSGAISVDGSASDNSVVIDSSDNLLVGKTSADADTAGFQFESGGAGSFCRSGNVALYAVRNSSNGEIIQLRKDGSAVGSIGISTRPYFASGDWGVKIGQSGAQGYLDPTNQNGSALDASINIGASGTRWKNLYLSGGAYLGGTGSANYLDDYEEGTFTPTAVGSTTAGTTTYNTQTGYYTKIGNMVTIYGHLYVTGMSGTGDILVSYPFTCSSNISVAGSAMTDNMNWNSGTSATFYARAGESTGKIYISGDNIGWDGVNCDDFQLYFSVSYPTS